MTPESPFPNTPQTQTNESGISDQSEQIRHKNLLRIMLVSAELKDTMRWNNENSTEAEKKKMNEPVAAHIYGMQQNASFIRDIARTARDESIMNLDWEAVVETINFHDGGEIITGDIRIKTADEQQVEIEAERKLFAGAEKLGLSPYIRDLMEVYNQKNEDGSKITPEANFVKTVDEIDALVYMIYSARVDMHKRTAEEEYAFFDTYTKDFPELHAYAHHLVGLVEKMQNRKVRSGESK